MRGEMVPRRRDMRQELAQEIVNSSDDTQRALDRFDERYRQRRLDLSIEPGDSDLESLEVEYKATLQAYMLEATRFGAMLSARQVEANTHMMTILGGLLEKGQLNDVTLSSFEGTSSFLSSPHPWQLKKYVEYLSGIGTYGSIQARQQGTVLQEYSRIQTNILHVRLRGLYDYLVNHATSVKIPDRLLTYMPDTDTRFSRQEQQAILDGCLLPEEVVCRGVDERMVLGEELFGQEVNSAMFMGALFAGSHAIEQRYPGISPRDTTRLLLQNADVLGMATRPKHNDALYMYFDAAKDENKQGTFLEFVYLATDAQKMTLDESDRLSLPLKATSAGKCPLSYSYKVNEARQHEAEAFWQITENEYGVQLPVAAEVGLATEYATIGIIIGERLINGRTQYIMEDFAKLEAIDRAALS